MAYGAEQSKPYTAGSSPTDALSAIDLGRAAVSGLTPMVQEITHEVTGSTTIAPVKVTTAGTRVRLNATSLLVRKAIIQALPTNTGTIVIGDANVVAAIGTQASPTLRGIQLNPADSLSFEFNDLTNVWIDSVTSGDGVTVLYFT